MSVRKIGISLNADMVNGDPHALDTHLGYVAEAGSDCAELIMHSLDVVVNGRVHPERLDKVRAILRRHPLAYTLHLPYELNLMACGEADEHYRVFEAGLDLAAAIGCQVVVYHSSYARLSEDNLESVYFPKYGRQYREDLFARLVEEEIVRLRALGQQAKQAGIDIGIENNIWYDVKNEYTYGIDPRSVAEHIRKIGLDNVGMTLDVGHCYLTSIAYGYSFEEAVKAVVPYLKHLHVHDNFGKLIDKGSYMRNLPYGYGDLHLPVGWGSIPYPDVLRWLDGYTGIVNMEIEFRFYPHFAEAVSRMRERLAGGAP